MSSSPGSADEAPQPKTGEYDQTDTHLEMIDEALREMIGLENADRAALAAMIGRLCAEHAGDARFDAMANGLPVLQGIAEAYWRNDLVRGAVLLRELYDTMGPFYGDTLALYAITSMRGGWRQFMEEALIHTRAGRQPGAGN